MISARIRIAAALAALALVVVACYFLVDAKRPIAAALFAPAAILSLPLFASTRPPRREEWASLTENLTRFRTAGLICFSFAVVMHTATVALGLTEAASGRLAALGVAWWAVGFALIPFALYFASRRAMLEDDSTD
jgi:hypothetical protein